MQKITGFPTDSSTDRFCWFLCHLFFCACLRMDRCWELMECRSLCSRDHSRLLCDLPYTPYTGVHRSGKKCWKNTGICCGRFFPHLYHTYRRIYSGASGGNRACKPGIGDFGKVAFFSGCGSVQCGDWERDAEAWQDRGGVRRHFCRRADPDDGGLCRTGKTGLAW